MRTFDAVGSSWSTAASAPPRAPKILHVEHHTTGQAGASIVQVDKAGARALAGALTKDGCRSSRSSVSNHDLTHGDAKSVHEIHALRQRNEQGEALAESFSPGKSRKSQG